MTHSEKCEKCGVGLSAADFVPCDVDIEDCPLLKEFNDSLARAMGTYAEIVGKP